MRTMLATMILATLIAPKVAAAQSGSERGVYLTIFRSPATGAEIRNGHLGAHAGFYPTVLSTDGVRSNVNFIRLGASFYARPSGTTVYASPSLLVSLDRDWKHGVLSELGVRGRIFRTLNGRLGGAVLTTFDGKVRVNPTVGMDIRVGGAR